MSNNTLAMICLVIGFLSNSACVAANRSLTLEKDGLVGEYYSSNSNKPPVLVLGGSEGGIPTKLAQPMIDANYPTLALAYFKHDGLPSELEEIPLEYFFTGKEWLLKQAHNKYDQLIIVGWSKGAEAALLLASRSSEVMQVIAIAPSSVAWAGILNDWQKVPSSSWTEKQHALPHVAFNPSGPVTGLLDLYQQSLDNRQDDGAADIPVQNISAKVALMTGENDEIWPSSSMAAYICQQMNQNEHNTCQHFNYLNHDHLLNYEFLDTAYPSGQDFMRILTSTD